MVCGKLPIDGGRKPVCRLVVRDDMYTVRDERMGSGTGVRVWEWPRGGILAGHGEVGDRTPVTRQVALILAFGPPPAPRSEPAHATTLNRQRRERTRPADSLTARLLISAAALCLVTVARRLVCIYKNRYAQPHDSRHCSTADRRHIPTPRRRADNTISPRIQSPAKS